MRHIHSIKAEYCAGKKNNKPTFRGRVSSLQVGLLNNLLKENRKLIEQLNQFLDS